MEPAGVYVFARRGRRIYRVDKCLITSRSRVPRSLKLKDGIVNLDRRKFRGQGRRADLLPRLPSESMRRFTDGKVGTGLENNKYFKIPDTGLETGIPRAIC